MSKTCKEPCNKGCFSFDKSVQNFVENVEKKVLFFMNKMF